MIHYLVSLLSLKIPPEEALERERSRFHSLFFASFDPVTLKHQGTQKREGHDHDSGFFDTRPCIIPHLLRV